MSLSPDIGALLRMRGVQLIAVTLLIVGVGAGAFEKKLSVVDPDVWWHVSVGRWIVQHRSFPQTGIFSRTAASQPWRAYSWGYELLISRAYESFGIMGMAAFGSLLTIVVALTIFWMLHHLSNRFWVAWMLTIVVCSAFLFNIAPRPVFLTAVLCVVTLELLLEAQRSGVVQRLYWLPLIFLLWANCHIQFIYGMSVLGLFVATNLVQRIAISIRVYPDSFLQPTLPIKHLLVILASCVVATCIGPYSFHLYQVVFGYATSKVIYKMLTEFQALSFKFVNQYIELLLATGAFFVIGWQKKIDAFKLALLVVGSICAFRMWRDGWFICIPAGAVIADAFFSQEDRARSPGVPESLGVMTASLLSLVLVAPMVDFNLPGLERAIGAEYPVDAVNFLRRNPVGGPLYNSFDWGGFLIFYMPEYPVSMDGRTDLYGDEMDERYWKTQEAEPSYSTDPYLNEAGLVLLENKHRLATVLITDQRFRVVYHDDIATVFARNW